MSEMQIGDYVVAPNKADRTLNVGQIARDFYVEESSTDLHANRRRVDWLRTAVPRAGFSASALHEVGSAVTLFRIKNHTAEFVATLNVVEPVARRRPPPTKRRSISPRTSRTLNVSTPTPGTS